MLIKINKAVLITGAAKRLGRAIALFFSKKDYDIIAHYNTSKQDALSLKSIIEEKHNKKCMLIQADLSNPSSFDEIMDKAFSFFPYCNVLINNASIFYRRSFFDVSFEDIIINNNIHVAAPLFLTQNFAKYCKSKGYVINIIDKGIKNTSSKYFSYMLSKKSLADLTKMIACELLTRINVNAVCPKIIPNDILNLRNISILESFEIKNVLDVIMKFANEGCSTGEIYFIK